VNRHRFFWAFVLGLVAALQAPAIEVAGHVRVVGRPRQAAVTTIVYAESLEAETPVTPGRFKMTQRNKAFVPHVLAVPTGSTIEFPNADPIFHNVFSLSPPAPFDLGLYRAGASKTRVFLRPAVYRVFCNIHPQMSGIILVLPTSFIAEADPAGNVRLPLAPGRYRVTAWSERSAPASLEVTVSAATSTLPELSLDESKFVEAGHKNKFGQDYPHSSYDPLGGAQSK
jgi:plastocyanin